MITTVTLNPSVDKHYDILDEIEIGKVIRVDNCSNTAGGKGLNVARSIHILGEKVVATGFLGGYHGAYIKRLLKEEGIEQQFIDIQNETRNCINIVNSKGQSIEFLEQGAEVLDTEQKKFFELFDSLVQQSDVITLSGSISKGMSDDIYRKCIDKIKSHQKISILDTSGNALREGIKSCPTVVKPNREELEKLLNQKLVTEADVIMAAKRLYQEGISYVVISCGSEGAFLICEKGVYYGQAPNIQVVNTVGCGDTMVGALAVGFQKTMPVEERLRYSIAVSCANALHEKTGFFEKNVCDILLNQVNIKKISDIE